MAKGIQMSGEKLAVLTPPHTHKPGDPPFEPEYSSHHRHRTIQVHVGRGYRPIGNVHTKGDDKCILKETFPGNLDAAAEELGMTPEELTAAIKKEVLTTANPGPQMIEFMSRNFKVVRNWGERVVS